MPAKNELQYAREPCPQSAIVASQWLQCRAALLYMRIGFTLPRSPFTKFRCGNHRVPVVTGRFNGIERQNRICTLCNLNKIGDEFHYLFECPKLESNRKKYVKGYYRIRPNTFKMCQLFNSESSKELLKLAKLAKEIMKLHLTYLIFHNDTQLYHFFFFYMKSSFPKGVRSILESSEKNDVF